MPIRHHTQTIPAARKRRQCLKPHLPATQPFEIGFKQRRPLLSCRTAAAFLNRKSGDIAPLVEDGRLRWAFDVSLAKSDRREIRILWQSVLECARLLLPRKTESFAPEIEFQMVLPLIVPNGELPEDKSAPRELVLSSAVVGRMLACDSRHIRKLIEEKSLREIETPRKPKEARLIARASCVQFLKQRRIM